MEQDAIRRAGAALKYRNRNRKRDEGEVRDPLKELFNLEVPTIYGMVVRVLLRR